MFSHRGYNTQASRLIVGLYGNLSNPEILANTLQKAVVNGGCKDSVRIIVPHLYTTDYNDVGKELINNLRLNEIMDELINQYGTASQSIKDIVVAGYSKGSQAAQRYSLVADIKKPTKLLLGCASSFTFLDDSVDYRYGIKNFPAPFNVSTFREKVKSYTSTHFVCGSKDIGSSDQSPSAILQGHGRIARAQSYEKHLQSLGAKTTFQFVEGVRHDQNLVLPQTGAYLCENI